MKKNHHAFTLAEILITLGIVGIISAMTIPNLIFNIRKKQLEAQIKVTYSTTTQILKRAEASDDTFGMEISDFNDKNMKDWFNNFIAPNTNVVQVCYNTFACWHSKGEVKDLNKNKAWYSDNPGMGLNTLSFVTAKGASFSIDGWGTLNTLNSIFGISTNQQSLIFYFDANGKRKPNIIGKDIYILVYVPDRGIIPAGSDKTSQQVEENCIHGNGYWCLKYLQSKNFTIPEQIWKR